MELDPPAFLGMNVLQPKAFGEERMTLKWNIIPCSKWPMGLTLGQSTSLPSQAPGTTKGDPSVNQSISQLSRNES